MSHRVTPGYALSRAPSFAGIGYVSLRRYILHLAGEAHAARARRAAAIADARSAALAEAEAEARERAFIHRAVATGRGYLVTPPTAARRGGLGDGALAAQAAQVLAARVAETEVSWRLRLARLVLSPPLSPLLLL